MNRFGELLFQEKNNLTKKAEPFCQVSLCENRVRITSSVNIIL